MLNFKTVLKSKGRLSARLRWLDFADRVANTNRVASSIRNGSYTFTYKFIGLFYSLFLLNFFDQIFLFEMKKKPILNIFEHWSWLGINARTNLRAKFWIRKKKKSAARIFCNRQKALLPIFRRAGEFEPSNGGLQKGPLYRKKKRIRTWKAVGTFRVKEVRLLTGVRILTDWFTNQTSQMKNTVKLCSTKSGEER